MKLTGCCCLASLAAFSLMGAEVTLDINDDATALVVNVPAGLLTGCKLELAYDASTGAASKFAPYDRSLNRSDWANATTLSESIPAAGAAFTVALADLNVAADACFRLFTTGAYTLLDYAWCNSESAWLDTGIKDTDVYALDVGFCPTARGGVGVESTSYGYPSILASISGSSGGMSLWHAKTGLKANFARYTDGKYTYDSDSGFGLKKDVLNTCVFRANSLTINGSAVSATKGAEKWVTSPVGLSSHTISLNRNGDATTTDSRTKWYYAKFYDRFGDLILDYVPASMNGVAGFFDRATGNFVTSTGAGALTAGATTNAATAVTLPVGKLRSFLRLAKRPSEVTIDKTAGATLTVRVNAGYGQGSKLYLAHGTTDGGDDFAAWSDRLELTSSIPADGGTYTVDLVAQGLDAGRLFRVFAGDEYTPLARVQQESSDDGIDTGVRDYNVYGCALGYYCTGLSDKYSAFLGSGSGSSLGGSGFQFYIAGSTTSDKRTAVAAHWAYESYTYKYITLSDTARNDITYSGHALTLNGGELFPQTGAAIWSSPLGTQGTDLYLGHRGDLTSNYTYGWWYYLTLEDRNGRKILDYLPVKNAAGTAGFFDRASGRFITPTDGGTLVAGEEKAAVGYMGTSLSDTLTVDDQLPITATWKGGTSGDLNVAANWACTNALGVELAHAVPSSGVTTVTFAGPIAFNVTSATDRIWLNARFQDVSLAGDCDWSALAGYVIDGTLDLAGNSLTMTDVPSSGEITSSGEDVSGEFHVTVAEGKTVDNTGCTLSGNLRFVKDGPGVFVATKNPQSYTAGTDILAGMLKRGGGGYTNDLGMRDTPVTVFTGAILDLRGCGDVLFFPVLAGGRLVNSTKDITNSWAQNAKVALEDDSSIDCAFSLGLIGNNYAPTRLDLGGYELDVVVANGKGFWLDNADVTAGLFKISGAGTFAIDKTSLRAAAADFDIATKTTVAVPAEVHDWTVRPGAAVSGNGMISINGTYHPMVADAVAKYTLKDGSKLMLSDATLPLNGTNETFAADATVTVDFGSRKVKPDDLLIAWPSKPAASVTFKLMPGVVGRLGIKDDGLYFRSGLMIIIR